MNDLTKISKSQFMAGLLCQKKLWLKVHQKDLASPLTPTEQAVIDQGNQVGELARETFPDGILIDAPHYENVTAIKLTQKAIDEGVEVIFEACAESKDGLHARIDILQKVGRSDAGDEWDLIEVKSSTKVKQEHIQDMAAQRYAFEGAGYKIRDSILMLVNNQYVMGDELDLDQLFKSENCTEEIKDYQKSVNGNLEIIKDILKGKDAPDILIGSQCKKDGKTCPFYKHCWIDVQKFSTFNVLNRASKKRDQLIQDGVLDLLNLDDGELKNLNLNANQSALLELHRSGKTDVKIEELKEWVSKLKWPIHFLDYETLFPVVPLFKGIRPYQQLPFQFSLHIQNEPGGELEHIEYLHTEASDPRGPLAEALCNAIGVSGSVISYNARFEMDRNNELAEWLPEYKEKLDSINERMVDLEIPFKKKWLYHPKMLGRSTIKLVLPAFIPDMTYEDMDIGEGGSAARAGMDILLGRLEGAEKDKVLKDLREYCGQDTLAMVKLLEVIYNYLE